MEISKSEFQVMDIIWQIAPCSANEIVDRLNQNQEWHEKTVKTLISRLVKKGAVSFTRQGREYIYSATIAKKDYQEQESQSFIQRLFKGKISPLVAAFAEKDQLSESDVKELKQLIDSWEKKND